MMGVSVAVCRKHIMSMKVVCATVRSFVKLGSLKTDATDVRESHILNRGGDIMNSIGKGGRA